jgi:hypothetical protein
MQGVIGYLVISGYDALSGAGVSEWLGASQIACHDASPYTGDVWRTQIRAADQLHVNRLPARAQSRCPALPRWHWFACDNRGVGSAACNTHQAATRCAVIIACGASLALGQSELR